MLVGTPDSSRLPSVSVRVFLVLSKLYTCLPCSLQVVFLIPSPLLFFSQAALGRMLLPTCLPSYKSPCLSLCALGRNLLSVTFPYPRLLPHVTLLAFLLVSNLSPYHLSTTVLLSGSAACGTESKVSFLFPFFPYLFIYSFPVLSSPSLQLLSLGAFGTQDSPCLPCVPICVLIQPIFLPFLTPFYFPTHSTLSVAVSV